MSGRRVNVVLDTSAVVAYTQGSIDVGEVMVEVNDENAAVALPILCLVEAYQVAADRDRLNVLVNHPATVTVTMHPDDWLDIAEFAAISGRSDTASAAVLAVDHHAVMLTRNPGVYAGMDVTFPIVGF